MPFESLSANARREPQFENALIDGTLLGKIVGEALRAAIPQEELIFVPGHHRREDMCIVKFA